MCFKQSLHIFGLHTWVSKGLGWLEWNLKNNALTNPANKGASKREWGEVYKCKYCSKTAHRIDGTDKILEDED